MKRSTKMLAFLMAALMVLSALPVSAFPALAVGDGSRNIDFDYETDNHIYNAKDALNYEAAKNRETKTTTEEEIRQNYDNLNWNHITYDLDTGLHPSPDYSPANDLTIKDNEEGSLRYYLTSEADEHKYIALTRDLTRDYYGNTVWETMTVTTDKVLDLNGYKIEMNYSSNRNNKSWYEDHYKQSKHAAFHNCVFITVSKGATLTIIDSSKWRKDAETNEGSGGVKFNGYMVSPHYAEMNYYTTRDLFHVNGNLVIYGGTFQAGRQKDQLRDNFSWSKLKTAIGDAVSLGVSVAEYATGISAATAAYDDVNETVMKEKAASSEMDNGGEDAASSTNKKDGTGAKPEVKKDTPTEEGRTESGTGRNQTVGEKKDTTNGENKGTAKPTDGKNQSNEDGTGKKNGSV